MKNTLVASLLVACAVAASGAPAPQVASSVPSVVVRTLVSGTNDGFVDTIVPIDILNKAIPQPLNALFPAPVTGVQIIASNTDDPFTTCKITCGIDGALQPCGSTTLKSGEQPSDVLDVSWADTVASAVCFRSALDPTVPPEDDGQ